MRSRGGRIRIHAQRRSLQRELEALGARRATRLAVHARAERALAQLQQERVARADRQRVEVRTVEVRRTREQRRRAGVPGRGERRLPRVEHLRGGERAHGAIRRAR